ncbi:hypothetical protein M885DRAFT_509646 [Pelagophyceae sp. CCMP2097]|nr:hypothetical protein M885DRAFT_509646 [Pelagophyceae sp. CCMP2097]
MALELALEAHFLSTASILAAAQVSKRWRDEVDKCALWSAANVKRVEQRVDAAQAAVAAADAMQQLAAGPVRRRQASAIGQLPVETRPKLVNFVTGAIHFASIARLVGAARLEAGESFVDLGCGAGFQLAAACVLVPLREVIGLELLRGYLDCATKMFDHLGARPPSVVLRLADFNVRGNPTETWNPTDTPESYAPIRRQRRRGGPVPTSCESLFDPATRTVR